MTNDSSLGFQPGDSNEPRSLGFQPGSAAAVHAIAATDRGHTWMFLYRPQLRRELASHVSQLAQASAPDRPFSWRTAANVCKQIRELANPS